MDFYVVDDDMAVVQTLRHIIIDRQVGRVVGSNTNANQAMAEILEKRPDIVMVDFLMKEMDGVSLIRNVKNALPETVFIMVSKVSDKMLVQDAYDAGIDFFVSKPVNFLEIERVVANVSERLRLRKVVSNIQNAFADIDNSAATHHYQSAGQLEQMFSAAPPAEKADADKKEKWLDVFLGALGMLGEKGTRDIRLICSYMIEYNTHYNREILTQVADFERDSAKNVEQRVRRAIKKGLISVASVHLEAMDSDASAYAQYVFDPAAIRDEARYIEGLADTGGRVSISRFMDGLLIYRDYLNS